MVIAFILLLWFMIHFALCLMDGYKRMAEGINIYYVLFLCPWNLRSWGLSSQNGRKGDLFAINCLQQRRLLKCMLIG